MFDANLMFRIASAGDLTADATPTLTIGPGQIAGKMACRILVPSQSGTTPTLDISVLDGNNRVLVAAAQLVAGSTYPAVIDLPIPHYDTDVLKCKLDVGGTTPNFGAVVAGLVPNTGYRAG